METMVISPDFWVGRRVFLTGHTGFKGGWLALWLRQLGAEVHGFSLSPPTLPNLFTVAQVGECMTSSVIGDIRESSVLASALRNAQPEVVFHLAAQPLVRQSYSDPVETFGTNVMGTVHLLEAVRAVPSVRTVVVVTTDKCYENREWLWGYRENDSMGGRDPYSSSKACAELATAAYRSSFLDDAGVAVASVRAGNVIGGGDWAVDRLVPDILRAFEAGRAVHVRHPGAVRPWQHVLEPLSGYLSLAERMHAKAGSFAEAWNFGPHDNDVRPVEWIVESLAKIWGEGACWTFDESSHPHESNLLKLDISKACGRLGWHPRWTLQTALQRTVEWHRAWRAGAAMNQICKQQIEGYMVEGLASV